MRVARTSCGGACSPLSPDTPGVANLRASVRLPHQKMLHCRHRPASRNGPMKAQYFRLTQSLLAGDCEVCIIVNVATLAHGALPQKHCPRARDRDTSRFVSLRTIVACELAACQPPLVIRGCCPANETDIGARTILPESFAWATGCMSVELGRSAE